MINSSKIQYDNLSINSSEKAGMRNGKFHNQLCWHCASFMYMNITDANSSDQNKVYYNKT